MKKLIIILVVLCSGSCFQELSAQREVMFAHYMFNLQEINPAAAGNRQSLSIISLNRSHWTLIFDKAPITQSLNMHALTNNELVGVGLSFRNEMLGPEKTTSVFGDFSYRIPLTPVSDLTFGLKAGIGMYNVPRTQLVIDDPRDPAFATDLQSHWLPNFGFGIYYKRENYFAAASIPKFLEVNYFDNSMIGGVRTILQERNYYFTAGAVIALTPDVDLVPTTFIRLQKGSPVEADLTANIVLFHRFSVGAMVRLQDAMGMMVGLWINEHWSVNYSFDWAILNRVPSFNYGSHELILRYDLSFLDTHRRGRATFL